jgi:hypothetical protein
MSTVSRRNAAMFVPFHRPSVFLERLVGLFDIRERRSATGNGMQAAQWEIVRHVPEIDDTTSMDVEVGVRAADPEREWQVEIYGRICETYLLANDLDIAEAVAAQMVSATLA